MACCKVCCGCAVCEEGDQGKCCCGTGSSAVCCEEGEYCCDGACQAEPCCTETECRQYTYDSTKDDEAGDFSTFAIGTCEHSDTTIESLGEIDGVETWRYTTLVTITCECLASFEAATGPLRGPDAENPGDPISYEVVPCCETDEDCGQDGYCCDGNCQEGPCCETAGAGCQNEGCIQPGCSTDSDCATGWPTPDTQECQDYYAACCGQTCVTEFDENNDPITTYCGELP